MVHDKNSEQEDLFPRELAEEQAANEKRVANERIRAKVELKNRIDRFWNKLYLDKLKNWRFDRKTIADYRFDYRFGADGDFELMFYFPTGDDLEFTDEEYEQYSFELKKLLTPLEENVNEDWGLSFFLSWRIESYDDAMEFAPGKGKRIRELMRDLVGETSTAEHVNILGTNRWAVKLDYSGVHPTIRLRTQLNTVTKVFVIDHFDEGAVDSLFDIDSLKWWSRADGEGIWGVYDAIRRRRSAHAEKPTRTSLIELIKGWFP